MKPEMDSHRRTFPDGVGPVGLQSLLNMALAYNPEELEQLWEELLLGAKIINAQYDAWAEAYGKDRVAGQPWRTPS